MQPKMLNKLAIVVILGLSGLMLLALSGTRAESVPDERQQANNKQLSGLFDFQNYKRLFNKRYGSLMEELNRKRLFFSRALDAFVTGVKYRFRKQSYYDSVNEMSDYTNLEIDSMVNEVMFQTQNDQELDNSSSDKSDTTLAELDGQAASELEKVVVGQGDELGYEDLRDALEPEAVGDLIERDLNRPEPETTELPPREMPPLINIGLAQEGTGQELINDNEVSLAASNSPKPDFKLNEQLEEVNWTFMSEQTDKRFISEQLQQSLFGDVERRKSSTRFGEKEQPRNGMFDDHRRSECFFVPRNQGKCGSCYAFAAVSIMEWLHCKKTGKPVAFSEQYMIDCGKGRFSDPNHKLSGCSGGQPKGIALFLHNFGMALRASYPYERREQQCRMPEVQDLKKTGHIRMEIGKSLAIPISQWETFIKYQPLMVGYRTTRAFQKYGGGLEDGSRCGSEPNHMMVLVGHGRQDGQEFWLIRNSFGPKWGELGHFKLAKSASKQCLARYGVIYGTQDGREHTFDIRNSLT